MGRFAGAERPLRLFLALELAEDARSALAAWTANALTGRDDLRRVEAGALHVTLVFLGATAPERMDAIWAATDAAATGHDAPVLAPIGVRGVPHRRPRLFALDLADEGGRAASLHAAVTGALGSESLHEPDSRPFWAHVTLARVRRSRRVGALRADPPALAPFRPVALSLYRSDPSPAGSRYTVLGRLELP